MLTEIMCIMPFPSWTNFINALSFHCSGGSAYVLVTGNFYPTCSVCMNLSVLGSIGAMLGSKRL